MIWTDICQILAAAVGTVAFSVLFSVPREDYPLCGLCGGAGWMFYLLMDTVMPVPEATFFATMAVVFLSRIFAVVKKCPATVFLITGIFPLVPGAGIYWATYYTVTEQMERAVSNGMLALQSAVAIVLGIVVVFEIPQSFFGKIIRRGR